MRNVLRNSDEVCHYWANKVQASGRSSNMSFDGDKLFSYRACIARHLPNGVVAIGNETYSVTTTRHQSQARRAVNHLPKVFVPYPDSVWKSCLNVQRDVEALLKKAATARGKRDSYLSEAHSAVQNFNAFAEALDDSTRITAPVDDPETLAVIRESVKAAAKRKQEELKERERLANLGAAEAIELWRQGGAASLALRNASVALRIKGDAIETSHGAAIPVDNAAHLWHLIKWVIKGGRDLETNQKVGYYRLTKVRKDGSIVVGCHDIAYSELEAIAQRLGLLELETA